MDIENVNIKADRPSIEVARRRLKQRIMEARRRGVPFLKVIHGYGSTGKGGALKDALRKSLRYRKREGLVQQYIYGERWGPFDEASRRLLDEFPSLARDSDYGMKNPGITIVQLKQGD